MDQWRFSRRLQTTRRFELESAPPFADIVREIADSMRVLCTHRDPCDEAPGYTRLVACVGIERALFDLFFNAATGYRGAYFTSPETGLRANADFLNLLTPALSTFESHPDLSQLQAEASMRAVSAKAWLAEVGKGFCARCEGEWTTPQDDEPDILNDRWELSTEAKARYGRKAPQLTKLRVIGGFVDELGGEYVATRKRDRAAQIHKCGWS